MQASLPPLSKGLLWDQWDNLRKSPWTPTIYSKCSLNISFYYIFTVVFFQGLRILSYSEKTKGTGLFPQMSSAPCSQCCHFHNGWRLYTVPHLRHPFPKICLSPDFLSNFTELDTFLRKPICVLGKDLLRKAQLLLRGNDHEAWELMRAFWSCLLSRPRVKSWLYYSLSWKRS